MMEESRTEIDRSMKQQNQMQIDHDCRNKNKEHREKKSLKNKHGDQ